MARGETWSCGSAKKRKMPTAFPLPAKGWRVSAYPGKTAVAQQPIGAGLLVGEPRSSTPIRPVFNYPSPSPAGRGSLDPQTRVDMASYCSTSAPNVDLLEVEHSLTPASTPIINRIISPPGSFGVPVKTSRRSPLRNTLSHETFAVRKIG
jgi:hypothetical protein